MAHDPTFLRLVAAAADALKARSDDVNRLNVFPVPDGDTGTNMSLTMDAVIAELQTLQPEATVPEICKAITHASLMGARGNSGVILSQVIRGVCDEISEATAFEPDLVARALERSRDVAYQAVRKPVEGTMLTVIKDCAIKAREEVGAEADLDEMLSDVVREAFASVARTPDLLAVLKDNDVVDAGAYGLAILAEGMLASYRGEALDIADIPTGVAPDLSAPPADDWDDDEYLYCTEFLLHGDDMDKDALGEYISSIGGSELIVGDAETLKIHVHTDEPAAVLSHVMEHGEVSEVHVNNMRRQTAARGVAIREEATADAPEYGIVTVAAGDGVKEILESLGADLVVNGGQTMNPSTAEILEACDEIAAKNILILPNNKNILLSAQQAAEVSTRPVGVIPTRSVPEAFSALLAFDADEELARNVEAMTDSASDVRTGEVTTAVRDSKGKVGEILAGQIIGIADSEIEFVGNDIMTVAQDLAALLLKDAEALTVLAGEELDDASFESLVAQIEAAHPDIEIEAHRGGQPLYPLVLAAE